MSNSIQTIESYLRYVLLKRLEIKFFDRQMFICNRMPRSILQQLNLFNKAHQHVIYKIFRGRMSFTRWKQYRSLLFPLQRSCYRYECFYLQAGELIARLELDDPSAVRKAAPFDGSFPILGPPTAMSDKVHQKCAATLNAARMVLAGYDENIDDVIILFPLKDFKFILKNSLPLKLLWVVIWTHLLINWLIWIKWSNGQNMLNVTCNAFLM